MESNKSFIITVVLIIIIIIGLLFYYFVGMNDNSTFNFNFSISNIINRPSNNTINNTGNNTGNSSGTVGKVTFDYVNDYQIYFNINSLINKYYMEITNGNYKQVLSIFDDYYIKNNGITGNNITSFIKTGYQSITYYSKEMYVKSNNKLSYYFVSGEEQLYSFAQQKLTEAENITYLVIVDHYNDTYSIIPLTTKSLADYAKNYTVSSKKEITSNAYNSYFSEKISDETICSYYINYFKTMLYLNSEKAYNMLDANYKKSFEDYEDFVNHLQQIYTKLNTKIMNYAVKGDNGKRTYSTISENGVRIKMTESSILNYKIAIEKGM